jgi:hypothetical protein
MKKLIKSRETSLYLCVLLMAGAVQGQQQTVEMKPGLWEWRMLKMTMDGGEDTLEPVRAQAREAQARWAKLPPERRSKQIYDPLAERLCIKAAIPKDWMNLLNIPGMPLDNQNPADCTPSKITRSNERITSERTCNKTGSEANGNKTIIQMKLEIVKIDEKNVKMATTIAASDITKKHTAAQETQLTFINDNCGDLKPADSGPNGIRDEAKK